ncbi:MAG: site-2 protease family protein [Oscillospiraceae bacterium]|jgi:stage IV sporulation protein FB|nr:site-2 protease family protein [Oscillospiraceae bacterium]
MRFKLGGVRFHLSVFFALGLCVIALAETAENLLIVIVSSLIHEFGHLAVLLGYGEKPKAIHIGVFGMEIRRSGNLHLSYAQECAVALSGPAVNLLLCLILFGFQILFTSDFFLFPALANLALALLNLLPITPLDGGRALYFLLCRKKGEAQAQGITEKTGMLTLFPLSALGFYVLIQSGYNYSLLAVCVYLCLFLLLEKSESFCGKSRQKISHK